MDPGHLPLAPIAMYPYIQQAKLRNLPVHRVLDIQRDKYGGFRVRDQEGFVYIYIYKGCFQAFSDRGWYLRILSSEVGLGNDMKMW